jgi:glycosyltransferase involved in cell wall biosynthesis/serine acetyltransferase
MKALAASWAYVRAPIALLRADVVHFHIAAGSSALRKSPIIWLASLLGRKIILHFHCAGAESLFDATPRRIQSFLRSRADMVVVLSPWWKREFEQRWPGVRIAVLPNPVASSGSPEAGSEPEILFVGALSKRKGYDLLLEAMAEVIREYPAAKLSMAGEGELDNAKSLARRLGIDGSVRFPGWVSGDALEVLYRRAQILCLPSYAEGVPMAMLEAMEHGLAVITTPVGGIPDVLVDGQNGILVPTGSPSAIATAIIRLLRNPNLRVRLGQAAKLAVKDRHSIAHVSNLLEDIYRGLHDGPQRQTPLLPLIRHRENGLVELLSTLRADWKANQKVTKGRVLVTCFRLAQFCARRRSSALLRAAGLPWVVFYRLFVGWVLGCELSENAQIGPGLVIYHGQGLVVSSDARIGSGCVLRHNTTLGNRRDGGGSPVIGDGVDIGANVCILGEVTVGNGARIGAGAVVVNCIPAGAVAAGNPARIVRHERDTHPECVAVL